MQVPKKSVKVQAGQRVMPTSQPHDLAMFDYFTGENAILRDGSAPIVDATASVDIQWTGTGERLQVDNDTAGFGGQYENASGHDRVVGGERRRILLQHRQFERDHRQTCVHGPRAKRRLPSMRAGHWNIGVRQGDSSDTRTNGGTDPGDRFDAHRPERLGGPTQRARGRLPVRGGLGLVRHPLRGGQSEATAPPPAARIYGVAAVALYEAVVPGALHHRSLVGQLNGLAAVPQPRKHGQYHWPTVANAALARTIRGLFPSLKPENLAAIDALEQSFAAQFQAEVKKNDYKRSVAHGQAVADAILAWAATDGYSTVNNCPYVPNAVPGAWEPTPPGLTSTPLQPCWGQLRPMVLISGAECAPPGPPVLHRQRVGIRCGRVGGI